MDRRSFMGIILASACAPTIVRASSLMRIVPRGWRLAASGALFVPAHYYVAENGDDAADGLSWAHARRTMASISLRGGDVVYVASGPIDEYGSPASDDRMATPRIYLGQSSIAATSVIRGA